METKKNPKVDVRRNSAIYFAVSLALTLFFANYFINYKTYDKELLNLAVLSMEQLEEDEIPITDHLKTPPPKKKQPVVPEIIEEIEDDKDIEESIIDTSDMDDDTEILDVDDVDDVVEEPVDEDVPFISIEHVPTFPGCEKGTNEQKRKCMSDKITKHVQRRFDKDLAGELGLSGVQKIYVMFKIGKNGKIVEVQSRAPHSRLQDEAERVINMLPKMKPGKQRGIPVNVQYSLPIIFKVQD
jgi:protein TonB